MGEGEDINPGTVGLGLLGFFESYVALKSTLESLLSYFPFVFVTSQKEQVYFFSLFVDRNI